jgi:hypothetical protein
MAMSIYDISSHDLCCWAHCLEKKLGYYSMNCVRAASSANAQQELAEMENRKMRFLASIEEWKKTASIWFATNTNKEDKRKNGEVQIMVTKIAAVEKVLRQPFMHLDIKMSGGAKRKGSKSSKRNKHSRK